MKPAWDQLAETWKDSSSVLIGDVDCTAEGGEALCSANGVSGYPTIKYYNAESGKEGYSYNGDRSFEALNSFVEDELYRECDVKTKDSCSEKELAYVKKMADQGQEKWAAEAKRLQGLLGKPSSPDQHAWLSTRHGLLEQLLGKRTARRGGRMKLWKKIAIAVAAIAGVILLNVLIFRRRGSPEIAPAEAEGKSEQAEAKKQEKEDTTKED